MDRSTGATRGCRGRGTVDKCAFNVAKLLSLRPHAAENRWKSAICARGGRRGRGDATRGIWRRGADRRPRGRPAAFGWSGFVRAETILSEQGHNSTVRRPGKWRESRESPPFGGEVAKTDRGNRAVMKLVGGKSVQFYSRAYLFGGRPLIMRGKARFSSRQAGSRRPTLRTLVSGRLSGGSHRPRYAVTMPRWILEGTQGSKPSPPMCGRGPSRPPYERDQKRSRSPV